MIIYFVITGLILLIVVVSIIIAIYSKKKEEKCDLKCNNVCYDPEKQQCCDNQIISKEFCCPTTNLKCNNICYDSNNFICENDQIKPKKDSKCKPNEMMCSDVCYNPNIQKCVNNKLEDKLCFEIQIGQISTTVCEIPNQKPEVFKLENTKLKSQNNKYMNLVDGKLQITNKEPETEWFFYDNTNILYNTSGYCLNLLLIKDLQFKIQKCSRCGSMFAKQDETCCPNNIIFKTNELCNGLCYDKTTQECENGVIKPKQKCKPNELECNNVCYNPETQKCCSLEKEKDPVVYNTIGLCGNQKYYENQCLSKYDVYEKSMEYDDFKNNYCPMIDWSQKNCSLTKGKSISRHINDNPFTEIKSKSDKCEEKVKCRVKNYEQYIDGNNQLLEISRKIDNAKLNQKNYSDLVKQYKDLAEKVKEYGKLEGECDGYCFNIYSLTNDNKKCSEKMRPDLCSGLPYTYNQNCCDGIITFNQCSGCYKENYQSCNGKCYDPNELKCCKGEIKSKTYKCE